MLAALRFGDYDAWNDVHRPRAVGATVDPESEGDGAAGLDNREDGGLGRDGMGDGGGWPRSKTNGVVPDVG